MNLFFPYHRAVDWALIHSALISLSVTTQPLCPHAETKHDYATSVVNMATFSPGFIYF